MSRIAVPRKRDRLRNLLGRSAPLPDTIDTRASASTSAQVKPSPITSQSQVSVSNLSGRKLLDDTLQVLQPEERGIIEKYLLLDINIAVDNACSAALAQKRVCEEKKWQWTFRGRNILLRDEADKVLRWLDRFKSVGDVVANVDPVHVGLPWAGIRMLLEMAVAESRQMAALLTGMSLVMYMANRLKVYFEYFTRLPSALATANFGKALVQMYAHILRFIAAAMQAYETDSATRTWHALWKTSSLEEFELTCDKLGQRAEIEASNCDRELIKQSWEDAKKWKEDLENAMQSLAKIKGIQGSVDNLQVKFNISKLVVAKGATYNSFMEEDGAKCLEGTRIELLRQIDHWARDAGGKRIFWLCGKAGTGKSTISRTVAHSLDERQLLGASFFFQRGGGDRGNAIRFFPTIAAQLASVIPSLGPSIANALDRDFLLCEKNLQDQFEKLLLHPLMGLPQDQSLPSGLILVIDALDESEQSRNIRTILTLLARVEAVTSLRLQVFVTSRPELRIGRRDSVWCACLIWLIGTTIQVSTHSVAQLIVGRFVNGICVGITSSQVPVYLAEIARKENRGSLVVVQQLAIEFGILIMYFVSYGWSFASGPTTAFRGAWAMQYIPALLLIVLTPFLPRSPRWLAKVGRTEQAIEILARIHAKGNIEDPLCVAEWQEITAALEIERRDNLGWRKFFINGMWKRTVAGLSVQAWQQLSGANVMTYYVTYVFLMAGLTGNIDLISSGVQYAVFIIFTTLTFFFIDKTGRRPMLIYGAVAIGVCFFVVGGILGSYSVPVPGGVQGNANVTIQVYASEVWSLETRASGVALASVANWLFNFAIDFFIPPGFKNITWRIFIIFGVLCFGAAVQAFVSYPETCSKTLEEIKAMFEPEAPWPWKTKPGKQQA